MTRWVVWSVSPKPWPRPHLCLWQCAMFRVVWICLVASGSNGEWLCGSRAKSSEAKLLSNSSTWVEGEEQSPAPFAETPIQNDSCLDYKSQNVRRFFFLIYGILLKTKFVGTNCGSAKPITLWRQPILITAITTNATAKAIATKSQKKSRRNSNNNGKSES